MNSTPLRRVLRGAFIFLAICVIAVIGYVRAGWSLSDSVYMVVITIFGVGYGEVRPIDTDELRTMTILVIVFGYSAAIYTVGGFIQMLVDGELQNALRQRKMSQGIANLDGHTIVCGYGRMGAIMAAELKRSHRPFLVVDESLSRVADAQTNGCLAMIGNATEEETLAAAGIVRAKCLATLLPNDASNAFICVTARDLNRSVEIIARGESPSAEKKLRRCGADHVVMMAAIGAKRAAQIAIRPAASTLLQNLGSSELLSEELETIGLNMEELQVAAGTVLEGKTLDDIQVRGNRGFLIVAVRNTDGEIKMNPSGTTVLSAGDVVIVVGHRDDIPTLARQYTLKRTKMTYRGASIG